MAYTEFGSSAAQTVKIWSSMLFRETFLGMDIRSLISTKDDACIKLVTDLDSSAGDTVKYDLLAQDRSNGVNGDTRLKGFEVGLVFYQDQVLINQKRHAHSFKTMSQQRTLHDLREAGRFSLAQWWAWFIEGGLFAHMAGTTGAGPEAVNGALGLGTALTGTDWAGNSVAAIDSGHTVDGTSGVFTVDLIDSAIAKAKTQNPRMAPIMVNGKPRYVLYLHPIQVKSMRTQSASWALTHKALDERGDSSPIYDGALGMWNGVILRESEHVPQSVANGAGSGVATSIMLGAGAGTIALGNAWKNLGKDVKDGGMPFKYIEDLDDYENDAGIAGASILGFKRNLFNSKALGCMTITSTETF